jgi:putative transposase
MARLARLEIPNGWYHVINRGHQRKAIFRDRRCYEDFGQRLGQFSERFGVKIHSYVLMPNHYHLLLELGPDGGLSAAMHWLNTGYGIWFNRRYRRQGALFQGRYKAILFDPDECLLAIHYYIHLNPVRVAVLKAAKTEKGAPDKTVLLERREVLRDYEWSSYRDYAGLRRPVRWLTLETVRERIGFSARSYRRELDQRITHDQLGLDWAGELVAGILMGSGEVLGRWKRLLAKQAKGDLKGERRRFGVVSWEEIIAAVEKEWRQPWQELRRSRGNNVQAIAVWFARHRAGMTLEQVRAQLGVGSYGAIAMQIGRLQRQLPQNPQLRKQLRVMARRLNVQIPELKRSRSQEFGMPKPAAPRK